MKLLTSLPVATMLAILASCGNTVTTTTTTTTTTNNDTMTSSNPFMQQAHCHTRQLISGRSGTVIINPL